MRLYVNRTRHLGATHAACLAACGHDVVGIDSDTWQAAGWDLHALGRAG